MFFFLIALQSWPFVYALMTKRTTAAYIALFRYIESNICRLSPVSVMSDYETGLRNAIRTVYPACQTRGCWFHLTQAVRRKATKIHGLFRELKTDVAKYQLYGKFFVLPLLPGDRILEGFALIKAEVQASGSAELAEFLSYFERQWIQKVIVLRICFTFALLIQRSILQEGPDAISVFGMQARTNNLVESHNSRLRSVLPPSGNFYKFADVLATEELRKSHELDLLMKGHAHVFKEKVTGVKRNAAIQRLQEQLMADKKRFVSSCKNSLTVSTKDRHCNRWRAPVMTIVMTRRRRRRTMPCLGLNCWKHSCGKPKRQCYAYCVADIDTRLSCYRACTPCYASNVGVRWGVLIHAGSVVVV